MAMVTGVLKSPGLSLVISTIILSQLNLAIFQSEYDIRLFRDFIIMGDNYHTFLKLMGAFFLKRRQFLLPYLHPDFRWAHPPG